MARFSRYRIGRGIDDQRQPGSRGVVLRNVLGITRKRDMDRVEYRALLAVQERYLELISADTRFTVTLIRRMHRGWLGNVYAWAGAYRTVELAKGGFRWPPARLVANNMRVFSEGALRRDTPCRPGPLAIVAQHCARVHAELLLIHPFRDGNGRLARWLADLMAMQAGLAPCDYGFTGRGSGTRRLTYLRAVQRGYLGDVDPLARIFVEALKRGLQAPGTTGLGKPHAPSNTLES